MKQRPAAGEQYHREAEERRIREAALDKTIEDSFPASDPPSTNPNPYAREDLVEAGDREREDGQR